MGIDRTRLARIELGSLNPYPEEVLLMSDSYNAPELRNYYCSNLCPIGMHDVPSAMVAELDRISISLMNALKPADQLKETILDIASDGIVSDDEKPLLNDVIKKLDIIVARAQELKIWAEKNL